MSVASSQSVVAVLSFVLAVVWGAGCSSPISPSPGAPYSQTDLQVGTGEEAAAGTLVTVAYTGWLYDPGKPDQKGASFDSSTGGGPFSFNVGFAEVIAGWDRGVPGMRVGGVRRLVIPPSLGYGGIRNGPIPPYATLVFEIELLSVVTFD